MVRDETAVHDRLAEFRDGDSECFACSLELIKEIMAKVCGIAPPPGAEPEPFAGGEPEAEEPEPEEPEPPPPKPEVKAKTVDEAFADLFY